MKKGGIIGAIIAVIIVKLIYSAIGNAIIENSKQEQHNLNMSGGVKLSKTFEIPDYDITVMTPSGWKEEEQDNFDLLLHDKEESVYMFIYAFTKDEIEAGVTDENLFYNQNEQVNSIRENVKEVEPVEVKNYEDRNIYTSVYSFTKDNVKFYQTMNLIYYKETGNAVWYMLISPEKQDALNTMLRLNIKEKTK